MENTTSKLFGLFSLKNHYSVHWGVKFKASKGIINKRLVIGGIIAIDKETNRQSDKQLNRQKDRNMERKSSVQNNRDS